MYSCNPRWVPYCIAQRMDQLSQSTNLRIQIHWSTICLVLRQLGGHHAGRRAHRPWPGPLSNSKCHCKAFGTLHSGSWLWRIDAPSDEPRTMIWLFRNLSTHHRSRHGSHHGYMHDVGSRCSSQLHIHSKACSTLHIKSVRYVLFNCLLQRDHSPLPLVSRSTGTSTTHCISAPCMLFW